MPTKSDKFNLEYFIPGSIYSSASDFRRFTTIDYNLESFIGIVGVGVISGWNLQSNGGLKLLVSYGTGIINGYFAESPYSIKRRTELTVGEIEKEVVRFDTAPEPYMSGAERDSYILVVQNYDPTYGSISNPCPNPLENTYVKSIKYDDANSLRSSILDLADNSDSYIYAEFPINWRPYPQLTDGVFTSVSDINEPQESDYEDLSQYLSDYEQYVENVSAYNAYKWQFYNENHFTEVIFKAYSSKQIGNNKVFLGVVTTRGGEISAIDVSQVEDLENLNAAIRKNAKELIQKHIHGGDKSYDPPKIRLETDIREAFLNSYSTDSGYAIFDIGEKYYTSLVNGHKHSFVIDTDGNGQTIEHFGDGTKHFHQISNFAVSQPMTSYAAVPAHTHTIPNNSDEVDGWTEDSLFNVYADKKLIGNQSSSGIELDLAQKQIKISGGIGIKYKTFSCQFEAYGEAYSYSKSDFGTYSFCVSMFSNYYSKFGDKVKADPDASPVEISVLNDIKNKDLIYQCESADKSLINNDDSFVLTTPVAKNISIIVSKISNASDPYKITIEVLGNSEVTGIISEDNIVYIHADKFLSGEFSPSIIPFVSHVGRLGESFRPYALPMLSKTGYEFATAPYITDVNSGHYHSVSVDTDGNGATSSVVVSGESVLYASSGQSTYDINHNHAINEYSLSNTDSEGVNSWQGNADGTNHSHSLDKVVFGENKSIYSILEDADGNIFLGTSDGLIFKSISSTYIFNINGVIVYKNGVDLWSLLQSALSDYERLSGKQISVDSSYEEQVLSIQSTLTTHGQSSFLSVPSLINEQPDTIMIEFADFVQIKNMYSTAKKKAYDISAEEIISGISIVDRSSGTEISINDANIATYIEDDSVSIFYKVIKNISTAPYWNMILSKHKASDSAALCPKDDGEEITSINILSANSIASIESADKINEYWTSFDLPRHAEIIKKGLYLRGGDVWVIANNSIFAIKNGVSRTIIEEIGVPSNSSEINDILEDGDGSIVCATNNGIYRTSDLGDSWTLEKNSTVGFAYILRDFSFDRTTVDSSHEHRLSVDMFGDGFTTNNNGHIHVVERWVVQTESGHDHQIRTTLYAIDNSGYIYLNTDGLGWEEYGRSNYSQNGKAFAFNGLFFLSTEKGFCSFDGNDWAEIDSRIPYSFAYSYDLTTMLIGTSNQLLSFDGTTISTLQYFDGEPQVGLVSDTETKSAGYYVYNPTASIFFDKITADDGYLVLGSFDKWIAANGSWETDNIDLYLDGNLVYSNDKNINTLGGTISKSMGMLDFSAKTTLTQDAPVYEQSLSVSSTSGFASGDRIIIYNSGVRPKSISPLMDVSNSSQFASFQTEASGQAGKILKYDAERVFATIASVSDASIRLSAPIAVSLSSGCIVKKIAELGVSNDIVGNIFQSKVTNAGTKTHSQLEDAISTTISGLPKKMQDAYLSNILQIAQATRYVYPEITDYFRKSKFYDMHYSATEGSEELPYIGDYIDTYNSEINSSSVFDSNFVPKSANFVYCVSVGSGVFSDKIFAGTDIGLFWAVLGDSKEENWVFAQNMSRPVYTVRFRDSDMIVGTLSGIYSTTNLVDWESLNEGAGGFSCYSISPRWDDKNVLEFQNVGVVFSNFTDTDGTQKGRLTLDTQLPGLAPNRIIQFYDPNNVSGTLTRGFIDSLGDLQINLKYALSPLPSDGTYTLKMSYWWSEFDGQVGIVNSLTNPVISAGQNNISVALNPENPIWQSAEIQDFEVGKTSFNANNILPVQSGSVLASVETIGDNSKAMLIKSKDLGTYWEIIKQFTEEKATVVKVSATTDGHTVVELKREGQKNLINGQKRFLSAYLDGNKRETFKVIWNETFSDSENIYLFGLEPKSKIRSGMTLVVSPISISSLCEFDKTIFVGTNAGLWDDKKSVAGEGNISGVVSSISPNAKITSIGITGIIKTASSSLSGNVLLNVADLSKDIYADELKNMSISITGISQSKTIVGNTSSRSQGEIQVEISSPYSEVAMNYAGRTFMIFSSEKTTIQIQSELPVESSAFSGGVMHVAVSPYTDMAEMLQIKGNGTNYIDVVGFSPSTSKIRVGNDVLLITKDGEMDIFATFNQEIEDMRLAELNLVPVDSTYSSYVDGDIQIISNEVNRITIKVPTLVGPTKTSEADKLYFLFRPGDKFNIGGFNFSPNNQFSIGKTSEVDGHYHTINLIGQHLIGSVNSITTTSNPNHIQVSIQNTSGFDNPILLTDPYLLKEEYITFTNKLNPKIYFRKKIIAVYANEITVETSDVNDWDSTGYNQNLISESWNFDIDARFYGYTEDTLYKDFPSISVKLMENIDVGDSIITVASVAGITSGQKVKITGEKNKYENNYVDYVVDSSRIKLVKPSSNNYFVSERAFISILSDTYSNTHIHAIKKNRVESKNISEYHALGLPLTHSHETTAKIPNVISMDADLSKIVVVGDSSVVCVSEDGVFWDENIDLNNSLEGEEIKEIQSVKIDTDGGIIAAADNMHLYFQNYIPVQTEDMETPTIE